MSDLSQFIAEIPKVTRFIIITSLSLAALSSLQIISPDQFICYWPYVTSKYQIYRILTGFLVPTSPQPMQTLLDIYMFYTYSKGLEETKFKNYVDYLYYYIIVGAIILLESFVSANFLLQSMLLSAVTYTWSRDNKNSMMNFYFLPIKASMLPLVSLGFRLLLNGSRSFFEAVMGVVAAYIYQCIESGTGGPLMKYISKSPTHPVNRVGTLNSPSPDEDKYDGGYLKAPNSLYKLLKVSPPVVRSNIASPVSANKESGSSSGFSSVFGGNTAFQGRGHRLGG